MSDSVYDRNMPGPERDEELLDRLFRKESGARLVAKCMLDGAPHTRDELAHIAGVSPTTVPRVAKALTFAGIHIEKRIGPDGRRVSYITSGRNRHDGVPVGSRVRLQRLQAREDGTVVLTTDALWGAVSDPAAVASALGTEALILAAAFDEATGVITTTLRLESGETVEVR